MKTSILYIFFTIITFELMAQCNDVSMPNEFKPNGIVRTSVYDATNNTMFFGGDFTGINQINNYCAVLPTTGITSSFTFPNVNGAVITAIEDGNGGYYIGGNFTSVGGQTRNRIAHVNSTGAVTTWNPNANARVRSLTLDGTILYAGGDFTTIGGQARNYISSISISTGLATTWNPNSNGTILSVVKNTNNVFVGGNFTSIGGQTRNNIAAINISSSTATTWNPNANSFIGTLMITSSTIYAGGGFSTISGQTRNHLAAIEINSGTITTWNPNLTYNIDLRINAFAIDNDMLYVGGSFYDINGQTRGGLASFNISTGLLTTWSPQGSAASFQTGVMSLSILNDNIYVGGKYNLTGQIVSCISFNKNTAELITNFDYYFDDIVNVVLTNSTNIFTGGNFTKTYIPRNNLASFNIGTGELTTWKQSYFSGPGIISVYDLKLKNNILYLGGNFQSISGYSRNNIAAIDILTAIPTQWNPNANGIVFNIETSDNYIYAAGNYSSIGSESRNNIACLDINTGFATTWNPNSNNIVSSLLLNGNNLYTGGGFTNIGGQARDGIAALNINTALATTWAPNANGNISSIIFNDNSIFVGGSFSSIGGQTRNNVAEIDVNTGLATTWNPNANSAVQAISKVGNNIYLGGFFTSIGGQLRNRIASVTISTGIATTWNPNSSGEIYTISKTPNKIFIGGNFSNINSNTNIVNYSIFGTPPDNPIITNGTNCGAGFVNLVAVSQGNQINWYETNISSTIISTLSNFTTTNITTTTTYYVESVNTCGNSTRLAVTATINQLPSPNITQNDLNLSCSINGVNYVWYLDNIAINGATLQTYTATANGSYKVKVTDANGCDGTSPIVSITTVGLKNTSPANNNFVMFPNPAKNNITILFEASIPTQSIQIVDILGNVITAQKIQNNQSEITFDISSLSTGVYFIKNNKNIMKFVKE